MQRMRRAVVHAARPLVGVSRRFAGTPDKVGLGWKGKVREEPGGDVIMGPRVDLEWSDDDSLRLHRRVKISWKEKPKRVFVVKKWRCPETTKATKEVVAWLVDRGHDVLVEPSCLEEFQGLHVGTVDKNEKTDIDLVVVLGGDGTLLHASRIFSQNHHSVLPPCVAFGFGSLGFLANFAYGRWKETMKRVMTPGLPHHATLRTRLVCTVRDTEGELLSKVKVLNDVVVCQGGATGGIGKFELLVDDHEVTLVQGDGIIVSTPSGSTGYNMSCGGAMVAPSVPCILLTPIAPSSLSFRPILINEQSTVTVAIPKFSRTKTAEIVCDGRPMPALHPGYTVNIETSRYPLPVINLHTLDHDWLDGITTKLNWNLRVVQDDRGGDDNDEGPGRA